MLFLRSFAFNLYFYLNITVWMIAALPLLLLPRSILWRVVYAYSRLNFKALRWLAGIDVELRGLTNLPPQPVIVAAKHQSAFETIALLHLFDRPAFILKKELMRVPLLGWYASKLAMIPVDRRGGQKALRAMVVNARSVLAEGRQIIIFPEGTRRAPGAAPAYKHGIIHLYRELAVPVVPVALNSGLYWPRSGFFRFPGRIVVEFLPNMDAGIESSAFFERMTQSIEVASDGLFVEGLQTVPKPPLSSESLAKERGLTNT
jgi:1-acyl-sn-glycerol-3-phosphate acyltransferase